MTHFKKIIEKCSLRYLEGGDGNVQDLVIDREEYSDLVRSFRVDVENAGIHKMLSKSSADTRYYIFARSFSDSEKMAVGMFASCVLVEPENGHVSFERIKGLLGRFKH
jgi:hypothetical protein